MRQKLTLGLGAIVAALALAAIGASAASAAFGTFTKVEFIKAAAKNKFTGVAPAATLTPTLEAGGSIVTCTSETSTGENDGTKTMTVKNVVVTFKGCKGGNGKEVHSSEVGHVAERIVTEPLTGTLGETETTTEATTKVALDLVGPGGTFVTLEGPGLPISPAKITGTLAGEVTPVNAKQLTGELVFNVAGGKQAIKKVCLLPFKASATCGAPAVLDSPKLSAFGFATATQMTRETITFEEATEVLAV